MTQVELQEAIDIIRDAHAACEGYHEQFQNDVAAQKDFRNMLNHLHWAKRNGEFIQAKIDLWDETAKAIRRKDAAELRRLQREQSGV